MRINAESNHGSVAATVVCEAVVERLLSAAGVVPAAGESMETGGVFSDVGELEILLAKRRRDVEDEEESDDEEEDETEDDDDLEEDEDDEDDDEDPDDLEDEDGETDGW